MKNLFTTIFLLTFSMSIGMTSTNPVIDSDNEKHSINFKLKADYGDLVSVEFDKEENALSFTTLEEMSFVQVLRDDGTLEFQLPLFSNEVIVDLDDFISGNYQVNLVLQGEEMISSTFEK